MKDDSDQHCNHLFMLTDFGQTPGRVAQVLEPCRGKNNLGGVPQVL